jgi:hypothetical protein
MVIMDNRYHHHLFQLERSGHLGEFGVHFFWWAYKIAIQESLRRSQINLQVKS